MTTFANYPIDQIQPHPKNVRRVAVADDELVGSIRSGGVLEPVILTPPVDDDGTRWLIAGNRRYDGAVKAGLDVLPAVLRDDLATEAQQIEAMLIENLHRSDLTVMEEADAYEQLQLFGMDDAAIAAATGRSKTTIRGRLKLTGLGETAKTGLHDGAITLADAQVLLDFADDPDTVAELEAAVGTDDFTWKARDLRNRRDRATRNAEAAEKLADLGAVKCQPDDGYSLMRFSAPDLRSADGHPECLGYVMPDPASYSTPYLVCLDEDSHAETENDARSQRGVGREVDPDEQARRDAAREEQARRLAEAQAATQVRCEWLVEHITGLLPAKGKAHTDLGRLFAATLPVTLRDPELMYAIPADSLGAAYGIADNIEADTSWQRSDVIEKRLAEHASEVAVAKPAAAVKALAQLLAALVDTALTQEALDDVDDVLAQLSAWDWLDTTVYPISEADRRVRDRIQAAADAHNEEQGGDEDGDTDE